MPKWPPSRPIPLSLNPPNGACATDGSPSFRPIIPYSNASLIWNAWHVFRENIRS